jgi:3-oxoacyl-[acyl-carrier protein] reductase
MTGSEFGHRVALVTGATRGIGRAIAERLATGGARVALTGRDAELLTQVSGELASIVGPDGVLAIPCDVTDEPAVSRLIGSVVDAFGKLDVLVNAAGIAGPIGPHVEDLAPTDFEQVMRTNVTGVFLCCRHAIPPIVDSRDGRIVNIASTSGLRGEPGRAGYVASKWALRGLTRALAVELGPRGTTVNAVCPHFTYGERTQRIVNELAAREGVSEEHALDEIRDETAMRAILEPADTAAAVAFLVSAGGRYITGQDIVVDAGCVV